MRAAPFGRRRATAAGRGVHLAAAAVAHGHRPSALFFSLLSFFLHLYLWSLSSSFLLSLLIGASLWGGPRREGRAPPRPGEKLGGASARSEPRGLEVRLSRSIAFLCTDMRWPLAVTGWHPRGLTCKKSDLSNRKVFCFCCTVPMTGRKSMHGARAARARGFP